MKNPILLFFALCLGTLGLSSAHAQVWGNETKVVASDGASGDQFGGSVAIDGTRMVVGVLGDDIGSNYNLGSVYVYDWDTGTNTWGLTQKLTASDGAVNDYFGHSVALDGNRVLVGAYGDYDIGGYAHQGSAYVFDLDTTNNTWVETQKLTASDGAGGDYFGHSVALDGNRVLVGAFWDDIGSNAQQGSAYVFDLDTTSNTWGQTYKLTASDGESNDEFGYSVALDGSRVLVGALGGDIGSNSNQGSAYIFDLDTTTNTWVETKLTASDGALGNSFGFSVALNGNRLLVAAKWGEALQGSAYVFDLDTTSNTWVETQELTASDGESNDRFGSSVALDGNRVLVGANYDDVGSNNFQGSAYVFDLNTATSTWGQTQKLTASDGAGGDYFGSSVALDGNRILVGAPEDVISSNGFVYIYESAPITVGGTVYGLGNGAMLTLQNTYGDVVSLTGSGGTPPQAYAFPPSSAMVNYDISVQQHPLGYYCTVANGSGGATSVTVNNVDVTCVPAYYVSGAVVSGLNGSLTLQNNGRDDVVVTGSGGGLVPFNFPLGVVQGQSYTVTIAQQPVGQTCSFTNGATGTSSVDVDNVKLECVDNAYTLGGTVYGLDTTFGGALQLFDALASTPTYTNITANGSYTLPDSLAHGVNYEVRDNTYPAGQTCYVTNSIGTAVADVTNIDVYCSTNSYTIGGTISGLSGNVGVQNGSETLNASNGSYTFTTAVTHGGSYSVSIPTQPTGQTCTVSNASGTAAANVGNVNVVCSANSYTIGGTITGLTGNVGLLNGSETLNAGNGNYTFTTTVTHGGSYAVSIPTQPTGQTCNVSNASGSNLTVNVSNVNISCTANTYTIGGTISGLTGNVGLQNGSETLTTGNGNYTFTTTVTHGGSYAVSIPTQPTGQTCNVSNASGSNLTANVSNVNISCTANTYTIGGTISGLTGTVGLLNGSETLNAGNGNYTFTTTVTHGGSYSVSIPTQPTGQTCNVTNASGTATGNVANVNISCTANTYTIGGTISGLTGNVGLQNGSETLTTGNGNYTFTTTVTHGGSYSVTIPTQPTGQTCNVSNASGSNLTANVSNVNISCTANTYTIGGTISGLTGNVGLQNGSETLTTGNGNYTFTTTVTHGGSYSVTIPTQPTGQTCNVSNASGSNLTANVSNVNISCTANTYTIGGTISGLSGNVGVQNGSETLTTGNGNYSFNTTVTHGGSYSVSIPTQPTGQTCNVSNASGSNLTANVSNVNISCTTNTYTIGGTVTGLTSGNVGLQNGSETLTTGNGNYAFTTTVTHGGSYAATVALQPLGQICKISNASGSNLTANVSNVNISCTANTYTIGGTVTGLTSGNVGLQNGSETLTTGNGNYTFTTTVTHGGSYAATVALQPLGQICKISNASGNNLTANVINVIVKCYRLGSIFENSFE